MKSSHWILASSVIGAALLGLMPHATGFAQSYTIRPTTIPKSQCKANAENFGFNDTVWRQWPGQPRPEERNSEAVGGVVIPTPPAIPERQLPHAENVPAKPPITGAGPGGSLLPTPGTIEGGPPPGTNKPRSDTAPGQNPQVPAPFGLPGIPESLDVPPLTPKTVEPATPLKDSHQQPEPITPNPVTPVTEPAKTPDKDAPVPKPSIQLPDLAPSPGPKPDEPTPAKPINKGGSLSRRGKDAVAASTTIRNELPMQANWNASLAPEAVGDNQLQSTSFAQPASKTGNPLRNALEGYCPVQIQENDRWVAGSPSFRLVYQGQVFVFSSDAARKRFEAAPEKYAPVQGGNDVVLAMEENHSVPGSVTHSAMWRGRLYLFSNSATLTAFQDDPARYTHAPQRAPLRTPADSL